MQKASLCSVGITTTPAPDFIYLPATWALGGGLSAGRPPQRRGDKGLKSGASEAQDICPAPATSEKLAWTCGRLRGSCGRRSVQALVKASAFTCAGRGPAREPVRGLMSPGWSRHGGLLGKGRSQCTWESERGFRQSITAKTVAPFALGREYKPLHTREANQ